jgi:DNA-binding GntR family transcriptional regulator
LTGNKKVGESDRGTQTLAQHVYASIRERLISGALSPGEKLSLRSIGDWLGVSMMPVREAVSKLVSDRALEVLPNRAVRVPVLSLPAFRELTQIRLAIEGFAAERAAAMRSAKQLAAMQRHDAAYRRQCGRPNPNVGAAVRANQALHFAVYEAAGLPSLIPIIQGLWLRIGPVLNLDLRARRDLLRPGGAEQCHAQLVTAIEARDATAARAALEADISAAAAFIEAHRLLPDGSSARPERR